MEMLRKEDVIMALKTLENHYSLSNEAMNKINAMRDAIATVKKIPVHNDAAAPNKGLSELSLRLKEKVNRESMKAARAANVENYGMALHHKVFAEGVDYVKREIDEIISTSDECPRPKLSGAVSDVIKELDRQRKVEGFTAESDLTRHQPGELAKSGICYLMHSCVTPQDRFPPLYLPMLWPWDAEWWKPKDKRRNVVPRHCLDAC